MAASDPELFSFCVALGDGVALVVHPLTFAKPDQHLCLAVFEVNLQRDQGEALFLRLPKKSRDLLFVGEELAISTAVGEKVSGERIRLDINLVCPELSIFDLAIRVGQVCSAQKDALDLGANEHDPRFESINNVVIIGRPAIIDRGRPDCFFLF